MSNNVLEGLKTVPGVIGGMLSDEQGNLLAHAFPEFFDKASLKEIASLISDNSLGIQGATGPLKAFDIRTELGRIFIKAMPKLFITVLCEPAINVQLLMITLNVTVKKLEKIPEEQFVALAQEAMGAKPKTADSAKASSQPPSQGTKSTASAVRTNDKGIILTVKILDNVSNMSANSVIGPHSATALNDFFRGLEYKSLHLFNLKNNMSVRVPVTVLSDDPQGKYDGVIGITPSLAGDLGAKNGDDVLVLVITKKGFF